MKTKYKIVLLLACIPQMITAVILVLFALTLVTKTESVMIEALKPFGDFVSNNSTAALVSLAGFLLWYGAGNFCWIAYKRGRPPFSHQRGADEG